MNEREREILRMSLLYMLANLSDSIECFSEHDCAENCISVNGDEIRTPTETEICRLLDVLQ